MAKTTIDELLATIELVRILQQTIGKHDRLIAQIVDKLEQRIDELAKSSRP